LHKTNLRINSALHEPWYQQKNHRNT